MQVDPILDNDRLSANDDLEMVEQHEVGDPVQQGMSQEEQEAFDLKTQGYCITGWNQICHTGEVAKARREERAERQQKRKDSNLAAYNRNKDHVINRLNREIESKNLEIQSQYLKISELNAAQKEMRREHQAELESHDHREALLLADLREACQANDEEVEALKETIDRQGKWAPLTTLTVPSIVDSAHQHSHLLTPTSTTRLIPRRPQTVALPMSAPSSPQPSSPFAKPSPPLNQTVTPTL